MEVDESNNFVYNKFDSMGCNSRLKLQELLIQTLGKYRDLVKQFFENLWFILLNPTKQLDKGYLNMTQPLNGIIFDFNGTLFLDNDKHVKAWSKIAQEIRGKAITEELHTHMNGMPNKMIVRYLNGGQENAKLEDHYSVLKEQYYRDFCRQDVDNFHLIAGAEALFNALQAKQIPFTIASASIKDNIDFFVESFHLDQWIKPEHIVYDDGTYENKIAMIHKAAHILGLPEEKITVIEDSKSGISSAIQAGIKDIRLLDSAHLADQVKDIPEIHQVVMTMDKIKREFFA